MEHAVTQNELMSALADGQLRGQAFAQALDAVAQDPHALACWHAYHVVGDVLRSPDLAPTGREAAFLARLRGQLVHEAPRPAVPMPLSAAGHTVQSEEKTIAARPGPARAAGIKDTEIAVQRESANSPAFAWKMVAGLASVAAVAAMGWGALGTGSGGGDGALAGSAGRTQVLAAADSGAAPAVIRDARLDELLRAHKQAGGASVLQTPSGFLRNATYETPAR